MHYKFSVSKYTRYTGNIVLYSFVLENDMNNSKSPGQYFSKKTFKNRK